MNATRRIDGIDLFRGIAAFAVVILHSDEGIKTAPQGWSFLLNFSAFAVPFFLATSFYLLVDKLSNSVQLIRWTDRFSRLLIPYAFWSVFYLGIKIQFFLKRTPYKINGLLDNWYGLLFLGQSEFHLYFIPLLTAGILLVVAAESFIRSKPHLFLLGLLLVFCIVANQYYLSLNLEDVNLFLAWVAKVFHFIAVKFDQNILKFLIKLFGFFLRCSSYIAVALIFSRLMIKDKLLNSNLSGFFVCLILFVVVNAFPIFNLPKVVEELLKGYITLALAIASSSYIKNNSIISSLGHCSFGIYLMHFAIFQILWSFVSRFGLNLKHPSFLMLAFSVVFAYLMSWILTHFLLKKKNVSKIIFGA
jgi:peptidoglycan/LPS O-acetylase OafA/YrhL